MRAHLIAALLFVTAVSAVGHGVMVLFDHAEGAGQLSGGCFVQAIKLESEPIADVEFPPIDGAGLYGVLRLADGRHPLYLDVTNEDVRLYVDSAGGAVFDYAPWVGVTMNGLLAEVSLTVTYSETQTAPYRSLLMWNGQTPTVLTYCRDSYREGLASLGGRELRIAVFDEDTDGRYDALDAGAMLIDTDGDGEFYATMDSHERFRLDEPFNVDGVTYVVEEVAPDGSWARIEVSEEPVAPKPPLLVGFAAPDFTGADAGGDLHSLSDFLGEIVVLDFWAAWCGPCLAELPTLWQLHEELGKLGARVVGINFDRTLDTLKRAIDEYDIEYLQLYDGADGPIGALYRVGGIPTTYVLDRDGMIVARDLRGEALVDAVGRLLEPEEDEGG
ncbi:TlpA family protein disulfide reductase [Candidatus Bipolaricaulota bacterium]|nr:TlpA family protein disulfide reductase [Candidatus Bipolaricaulota bacterium]